MNSGATGPWSTRRGAGGARPAYPRVALMLVDENGDSWQAGAATIGGALDHDGLTAGFYGTASIAKQTGVAVDAAGIHAALVALGLIAA